VAQLAEIDLAPDRPLVVCDADEVIFDFMTGFEASLGAAGLYFTWSEFRLNGNIRSLADDRPVEDVRALVEAFFAASTRDLPLIDGARDGLATLARSAQLVVLSNLPLRCRADRGAALAGHGIEAPVVANIGSKGPPVRSLAERVGAPVFFIDDSPAHHADVALLAERVRRLQFIGHPRLATLLGPAAASHYRATSWPDLVAHIQAALSGA
jgi:hypothetical protein